MIIRFYKMHGAANDFILVDDREEHFPIGDRAWMAGIAARRTGIGCEGVILIQSSDQADFRMRFINPDGGEVEMCGNGARCVARLAADLGAAPSQMSIETVAGLLRAEVFDGGRVRLEMTPPQGWRMQAGLTAAGQSLTYHFVNTGVPHAVLAVDDLESLDVQRLGAAVRGHKAFQPSGTNVNFVRAGDGNTLRLRTYERGVEGETLACGTGMVAAGLVAARLGLVSLPVTVIPASGDHLEVGGSPAGDTFEKVSLTGPAEYVFEGWINYP